MSLRPAHWCRYFDGTPSLGHFHSIWNQ